MVLIICQIRGSFDKNQMGVMGWSNGAIIATMLTVRHPEMFKVACPGAGDVNWTSGFRDMQIWRFRSIKAISEGHLGMM